MLKKKLKNNIRVMSKVTDWQVAIKEASKNLIEKKCINEEYVNAMIDNIKKLGPYVIIADDVAMPHSRPEDGVLKTSLALLKLKEPVLFGDNGALVRLVFVLAAESSTSHIDLITELVELLQNEEKFNLLLNSDSEEEILRIL